MKIKNYTQLLNEGFFNKKNGNDFANKLIDIIEKENIKITKDPMNDYSYEVILDGTKYIFNVNFTIPQLIYDHYLIFSDTSGKINKLEISIPVFMKFKKVYKNQKRDDDLPDLSDIGRSSKKYNI